VRRRKPTTLGIIGTTLAALGVMSLAWASIEHFRPDLVGIMLVVVGAVVICYKRLETKNLAADEIYKLAYDRGKEDGYDEGYADRGLETPERPVVVAFPGQCVCGGTVAKPHMAKAGRD